MSLSAIIARIFYSLLCTYCILNCTVLCTLHTVPTIIWISALKPSLSRMDQTQRYVSGICARYNGMCLVSVPDATVCVWYLCQIQWYVSGICARYNGMCLVSVPDTTVCVWYHQMQRYVSGITRCNGMCLVSVPDTRICKQKAKTITLPRLHQENAPWRFFLGRSILLLG